MASTSTALPQTPAALPNIQPPDPAVLALSSSPAFPPPAESDLSWATATIKIAVEMTKRGYSIKGSPIDDKLRELVDLYSEQELKAAVLPFATGHGAWFLKEIIARRDEYGKSLFTLNEIQQMPLLDILSSRDGVYGIVHGKAQGENDEGEVMYEVSTYVGISWQATYGLPKDRETLGPTLAGLGYDQQTIQRFFGLKTHQGIAARVCCTHLSPHFRESALERTEHYRKWDVVGPVLSVIQLFGNNDGTPSASELQDRGSVTLMEHVGIMGSGGWDNAHYESAAKNLAGQLGIENYEVSHATNFTQKQVGLEQRNVRDYRSSYLDGGSQHSASDYKQADGRVILRSNEQANLGGSILKLPGVFDDSRSTDLRIEVSFNLDGAKKAWRQIHPKARVGNFAPLMPVDDKHNFMIVLITGYDKKGHCRTVCLADENDPGTNSHQMLERTFRSLISRLWAVSNAKAVKDLERAKEASTVNSASSSSGVVTGS